MEEKNLAEALLNDDNAEEAFEDVVDDAEQEKERRVGLRETQRMQAAYRKERILNLASLGISASEIARQCEIAPPTVLRVINDPDNIAVIRKKQAEIFIDPKAKLSALYDKAWGTLDDILSDPDEKSAVKANVAMYIIDHKIGKAQQTVKHEGNLLNEILVKIEKGELRDVIEATKTNLLEKPKNKMDAIMEALELDDVVIGKRGETNGES